MHLHCPVHFTIFAGDKEHESGFEHSLLVSRNRAAVQALVEHGFHFCVCGGGIHHVVQRMVAQAAVILGKVVHADGERLLQISEGGNLHFCCGFQLGQIVEVFGLFQVHGFVRTPGGQHGSLESLIGSQLLMPFERIHGIIGGADGFHVAHVDQTADAVAGTTELLIAQVPHFIGGFGAQRTLIAEEIAPFKVAPMIQGIADGLTEHLSPFAEFFIITGITGDVFFRNAGTTHQPPLVVVTTQPNLRDVFIPQIFPDFLGADVAVIVNDGALGSHVMIQRARGRGVQQKVLVHESLHIPLLLCKRFSYMIHRLDRREVTGYCHAAQARR